MSEFRTKEEYEAWKGLRLKDAKENPKVSPYEPIINAVNLKLPSRNKVTLSDIPPLLLLGGLAAVFAFFVVSLVLKGR